MKKFFITLLCIGLVVGGFIGVKKYRAAKVEERRIEEAKKGWHVEILTDYINIRDQADRYSNILGQVKKGGIYKKVQNVLKCYDELKDMIVLENNVKILVKYIIELKSDIFEN